MKPTKAEWAEVARQLALRLAEDDPVEAGRILRKELALLRAYIGSKKKS